MLNRSETTDAQRQQLSSLMDGDLPADATALACALWRQHADARHQWHAYHLIGDVLRSDDLAAPPSRDEAFLQALRLRLADEAVPLAPAALQPATQADNFPLMANGFVAARPPGGASRRRSWLVAPVAVAAGFVAVAGVVVVTRVMAPEPAAVMAAAPHTGPAAASAVLVRNVQLDRYLDAHRTQANGGMPGGAGEHRVRIVFEGQ